MELTILFSYTGKKVFFYDGSWECYQGFHLAFFIVSIIVIICLVVLPVILLAIIVHRGAGKKYCCFTIEQPVIDAIAQGLRYMNLYFFLCRMSSCFDSPVISFRWGLEAHFSGHVFSRFW